MKRKFWPLEGRGGLGGAGDCAGISPEAKGPSHAVGRCAVQWYIVPGFDIIQQFKGKQHEYEMQILRQYELWLGVHPLPDAQAPPRPRRQQVHLVWFHLQRLRLHPQSDRQAREVIPGDSLPLLMTHILCCLV